MRKLKSTGFVLGGVVAALMAKPLAAQQPQDKCLTGKVLIHCIVAADLRLSDCVILSETPPGKGFGDATLKVARLWKMRPSPAKPEPTAGDVFQRTVFWKPPPDCVAAP